MKTIPPETKDKVRIKATGTLPNGAPVIINSDGTVSTAIDNSETPNPQKEYIDQASPNSPAYIASVYDSYNDRVVFAWRDQNNSNYGTAIVGQIKGRTITWGTKTTFLTAQAEYISMAFDTSQNKVLICFKHDGDAQKGYGIVATVDPSNNSITFGTAVKFNDNGVTLYIRAAFDSNSNKTVIVYSDGGDSYHGYSIVATISGTSVSYGTAVEFVNIEVNELAVTFDSEHNKIALAYRKGSPNYYGAFKVGDVSGTSITWGLDIDILTANMQYHNITFDTTNNFVVGCFMDGGSGNKGTLYVLEITDSFASNATNVVGITATVFATTVSQHINVVYNPNSRTTAILYYNGNSGHSYILEAEVHNDRTVDFFNNSGTALAGETTITYVSTYHAPIYSSSSKQVVTFYVHGGFGGVGYMIKKFRRDAFGAAVQFESHAVNDVSAVYNAATKRVVVAYRDTGEGKGYAVVGAVGSDNTISFGTPVEFYSSQPNQVSLVSLREEQDNNDKVVIVFAQTNSQIWGRPAQINPANNSLTLGNANSLNSNVTSGGSRIGCCAYPPSGDAIIVSFDTNAGTAGGYTAVGVLNTAGTDITFGGNYIFNAGDSPEATMEYDPTNQVAAVFYRDDGNNNYGTSRTLAVTNTNQINYNSEVVFSSVNTTYRIDVTFKTEHYGTNQPRFEIAFMNTALNNGTGQIVYGFISGSSIVFSGAASFQLAVGGYNPQPSNIRLSYNEEADLTPILYQKDSQNKTVYTLYRTVVGGGQEFFSVKRSLRSEASPIYNINSDSHDIVYDANAKKTIVFFKDGGASNVGKAVVIDIGTANLTSENFIGMVNGGTVPTDGQAIVDIVGTVNENQSGLTIGQQYYVQKDGTLSTTADTPSVLAGTALSTTKLLVKK
tara:strand:- start:36426 stop:39104 length:2679 start_codon:yes stop_codon:yes gene_type:complete